MLAQYPNLNRTSTIIRRDYNAEILCGGYLRRLLTGPVRLIKRLILISSLRYNRVKITHHKNYNPSLLSYLYPFAGILELLMLVVYYTAGAWLKGFS
ncbi:Hypothetical predicted protein, partial [Prunus dulcis]